jgi:hypothetical protein
MIGWLEQNVQGEGPFRHKKHPKLRGRIAIYFFALGLLAYIVITLIGAGLLIKNAIGLSHHINVWDFARETVV